VKFGIKEHTPSELPSLHLLFRGLECDRVPIYSSRKSKCHCKLNGNGRHNEYRKGKGDNKEGMEKRDDVKILKKKAEKKAC